MPRCSCGSHVFGSFFLSALLPPRDEDEPSFYEVLGLDESATDEEIRKAYRKLSLKLHPDKIAQRGGDSSAKEEAAAEYEKIQEAYGVLTDEKKRIKYNALGSPTRYRFVEKGGFGDPQTLYENLISSSFEDRARLVGLFFLAILLILMQPILICAKINQSLDVEGGPLSDSSWAAILTPYWVMGALFILLNFVGAFFVSKKDLLPLCLAGCEQIFWFTGVAFLCNKWDGRWDDFVPYREVLIPVYIAMTLRWARSFLTLRNVRNDCNRMVTSDYIEVELLKGRSMEEIPEEEQDYIMNAFMVVSPNPEFLPSSDDLTAEELEEEKVASSPEFESAMEIYSTVFYGLLNSLVFGIMFLILLTLKLDDRLGGGNWWAVFSPFWIERGGRLLYSLYKCCFGGLFSGDEVVLYAGDDFPAPFEADGNTEEEPKDDKVEQTGGEVSAGGEEKSDSNVDASNSSEKEDVFINSATTGNAVGTDDKPAATSSTTDNDTGGDNNNGDEIHLDEETFDAFQSVYQEANDEEKQEKAKACTEAFFLILQIILLCLVVAKIEKNYDNLDPFDVGFNVFWILFPFFLFFGCTLCCCAILIFGAAPEPPEGEMGEAEEDPENPTSNNDENTGEVATIPAEEEVAVDVVPENTVDEPTPEQVEPSDDMDDLD